MILQSTSAISNSNRTDQEGSDSEYYDKGDMKNSIFIKTRKEVKLDIQCAEMLNWV